MHPDLENPPVYEGVFLRAMAQIEELAVALKVYEKGLQATMREVDEIEKQNKKARKSRRNEPEFPFRDAYEVIHEEEAEEERLLWAKQRASFAEKQIAGQSPYLYILGTIRLWGLLEAMVDDGVAELIDTRPPIREAKTFEKLEIPFREFTNAQPAEQASIVVRALKDQVGASKQNGTARFESLLGPIGLGGPYDKEVEKIVRELSAARHILVHRDGVIDDRFLRQCPWIKSPKGEKLAITDKQFRRYSLASEWCVLEYYRRLRQFDGAPQDKDRLTSQIVIAKVIRNDFKARLTWPPSSIKPGKGNRVNEIGSNEDGVET